MERSLHSEEGAPQSPRARREGLNRADLEGVLTFVGLLNTCGGLVEVGTAAPEAADLDAGDVLGRPLWETPWWSWSESEQRRLRRAVAEVARGPSVRYEAEPQVADAVRIVVDFQLVSLRGEHGTISRLVPPGIDVTGRRRREDPFDELIAHAPVVFASRSPVLRGRLAGRALVVAGTGHVADSRVTDYELRLVEWIPDRGHPGMDAVGALGLAAIPWLIGGDDPVDGRLAAAVGLYELSAAAMSDPAGGGRLDSAASSAPEDRRAYEQGPPPLSAVIEPGGSVTGACGAAAAGVAGVGLP